MAGLRGLGIVSRPVGTWTHEKKSTFSIRLRLAAGEFLNRDRSRDRRPRECFTMRAKDLGWGARDAGLLNSRPLACRRQGETDGGDLRRHLGAIAGAVALSLGKTNGEERKEKAEFGERKDLSHFPSPQNLRYVYMLN